MAKIYQAAVDLFYPIPHQFNIAENNFLTFFFQDYLKNIKKGTLTK